MVAEFLKKYQDQLIVKKDKFTKELEELEVEIRKQEKFISAISEDVSEPFSAFSPHAADRTKQSRIDEQSEKMEQFQIHRTELDQEIQNLNSEIMEVERSLQELGNRSKAAINNEVTDNIANTVNGQELDNRSLNADKKTIIRQLEPVSDSSDSRELFRKIRNAYDFLPADPMRAKGILAEILSK